MKSFEESNLYSSLVNFHNVNDENFIQFMAEFYNTFETLNDNFEISKEVIQDLQDQFTKFKNDGYSIEEIKTKIDEVAIKYSAYKNYLVPEQYGAKGNGITDDTIALKNCIADAKSKNFNIVFQRNKSYKIIEQLTIDFPVTINFSFSEIKIPSQTNDFYGIDIYNTNDVIIKNFKSSSKADQILYLDIKNNTTSDGRGSNVNPIYIRYSDNIVLENIYLETTCGLGGHNSTNITIKNYVGKDLEMPFYFGNVENLNVNGFDVYFNNTPLSGFYHGIYLNNNTKNVTFENGYIHNKYDNIISDPFNFLTSADNTTTKYLMDNVRVKNVVVEGKFKQCIRLGEMSNCYFDKIYFSSIVGENIIEHCKCEEPEYCKITNSEFYLGEVGNDDRGFVKEGYASNSTFFTEFENCKIKYNYTTDKTRAFIGKIHVKYNNVKFECNDTLSSINLISAYPNVENQYEFLNCEFNYPNFTTCVLAVNDFSTSGNSLLLNNCVFNVITSGFYSFYCTGGVIINCVFKKARNIINSSSNAITNNNIILETIS